MVKLADYVARFIADAGVSHVFMASGDDWGHLAESIACQERIESVLNLSEQACAVSAEMYGQITNNLGVALFSTGSSAAHALTGVAGAWFDSTPMLIVSGQVRRSDAAGARHVRQFGFQEVDVVSMARPITKYAITVKDPQWIRYHLEQALWQAQNGRPGPVWLEIPEDVQGSFIDPDALQPFVPTRRNNPDLIDSVGTLLAALQNAERPAILVGNGVRLAHVEETFLRVAHKLNVPVLTTWKALDLIDEDDAIFAGRPGAVGQRGANFVQQNSDWLLVLGARCDLGQTAYDHGNFAPHAFKAMVDVDPHELAKMECPVQLAIEADAGEFLETLECELSMFTLPDFSSWLQRCADWKRTYPIVMPEYREFEDGVSSYVFVEALSEALIAGDLVVPGSSGACGEVVMQALKARRDVRVANTQGVVGRDFGLPAAIGACLAGSKARTICVEDGDGFGTSIQELETVRRLDLPIKIFVLSAGSGSNLSALAGAYGISFCRLESHKDIEGSLQGILDEAGPILCEIKISAKQCTAPKVTSSLFADGAMSWSAMEDMSPFLSRDELEANMSHGAPVTV